MGQTPSSENTPPGPSSGQDGKPRSKPVEVRQSGGRRPEEQYRTQVSSPPSSLTHRVKDILNPPQQPAPSQSLAAGVPPDFPMQSHELLQSSIYETVPTAFRWTHGGHQVYLTGSFTGWKGKILMMKDDTTGEFSVVIDIPPGTHQFKFVVDNVLRLNPDLHTVSMEGQSMNQVEVNRPVFEDPRMQPFVDSDVEDEPDASLDQRRPRIAYGQKVPPAEEYVKDPPKMPPHLTVVLLNQPRISMDPCLLPMPQHVSLNHPYIYTTPDPRISVTAVTQRFQTRSFATLAPKFVTTVYYAPKPTTVAAGGGVSIGSSHAHVRAHAGTSASAHPSHSGPAAAPARAPGSFADGGPSPMPSPPGSLAFSPPSDVR